MTLITEGYEPRAVLAQFEAISAIPRSSGNEQAVSDYLVTFARERGLPCERDALLNVIIRKPASPGCESAPTVMLQGHMDMVCEKTTGVDHDFAVQGIRLQVQDGILSAKGTTLGADNGIAVALMLAVLDGTSLRHPALECVFTSGEEIGLLGAMGLDASGLKASVMINLDSEEEGVATVSCAGAARADLARKAVWDAPQGGYALAVTADGLLGGHSGVDIGRERLCSSKLMARLLCDVSEHEQFELADFHGGTKRNAIARRCDAVLVFPSAGAREAARKIILAAADRVRAECGAWERTLSVCCEDCALPARVMSGPDAQSLLRLLYLVPFGALNRNYNESFVVNSANISIVSIEGDLLRIHFSLRGSVESLLRETMRALRLYAGLFGFEADIADEYPGWQYAEVSPVRDRFIEAYRALFGGELRVEALHAGLECGIFQSKLPGLDAIAVGPTVLDVHTPQESADLASCARFWKLLLRVLDDLGG